jgi:hypothetical protein
MIQAENIPQCGGSQIGSPGQALAFRRMNIALRSEDYRPASLVDLEKIE